MSFPFATPGLGSSPPSRHVLSASYPTPFLPPSPCPLCPALRLASTLLRSLHRCVPWSWMLYLSSPFLVLNLVKSRLQYPCPASFLSNFFEASNVPRLQTFELFPVTPSRVSQVGRVRNTLREHLRSPGPHRLSSSCCDTGLVLRSRLPTSKASSSFENRLRTTSPAASLLIPLVMLQLHWLDIF